jgi:hypothetical protein
MQKNRFTFMVHGKALYFLIEIAGTLKTHARYLSAFY